MSRSPRSPIVPGFRFAGLAAGIKPSGARDLALIVADEPASVAGLFTTNRVKAAPVLLSRRRVRGGLARAIVVNSGNANAATGRSGAADAEETTALVADAVDCPRGQVLVCSTGVIGRPMPMDAVRAGVPRAVDALSPRGLGDAAEAILTTDTRPKVASRKVELPDGRKVTVAGFAKGSGMLHPNMATMLAYLVTDAPVPAEALHALLARGCDRSFHAITVDGDQSTNDTVLMLASGRAGGRALGPRARAWKPFEAAVFAVMEELAEGLVADGEGATRTVEVRVTGGRTEREARRAAQAIAESLLVKTAVHGADPNWGRILAAAGSTRIPFDPEAVVIRVGGVVVYDRGRPAGEKALGAASRKMARTGGTVPIRLDLARGDAEARVWTCDLSAGYVRINADYTT